MATDRPRLQAYLDPELHQAFSQWKKELGIAKDSEALNYLLAEYFGVPQSPISNPQSLTEEKINGIIGNSLKDFGQVLDFRLDTFQAQIDTLKQTEEQTRDDLGNIQFLNLRIESLEKRIEALEPEAQLLRRLLTESLELAQESESLVHTQSPEEEEIENIDDIVEEKSVRLAEQETEVETQKEVEYNESPGKLLGKLPDFLNAANLARRLRISKSVISRRKSLPDFQEWSKRQDPAGIGWRFPGKGQRFFPVP